MSKTIDSFVSDARRNFLANAFRDLFGDFAVVTIALLRKETDEDVIDGEFVKVQGQVRWVLEQKAALAQDNFNAVYEQAKTAFNGMKQAAGGRVAPGVASAHFAESDRLKEAVDAAMRNLNRFDAEIAELAKLESRLLKASKGERPVRKAA